MSVLVKGMKMPKSCYACKLDLMTDVCPEFDEWYKKHPYSIRATDRLPDCPLVELPEKHGDLIDRDALPRDVMDFDVWNASVVIEAEGKG